MTKAVLSAIREKVGIKLDKAFIMDHYDYIVNEVRNEIIAHNKESMSMDQYVTLNTSDGKCSVSTHYSDKHLRVTERVIVRLDGTLNENAPDYTRCAPEQAEQIVSTFITAFE